MFPRAQKACSERDAFAVGRELGRIDDQRVAFPMADRVAVERRAPFSG